MDIRIVRLVAAATLAALPALVCAQIAFIDTTKIARVDKFTESYGASWGDLNGDGYPDLFASNHRTQPSLFLNRGNGTFYETAPQVLTWRNRPKADTHGGSWADFDNDGDQDLLVSAGTGNLSQLLVNEGQRLVDRTKERGLTTVNLGGRLPVWLDYDGDKLLDFVMTQFGGVAKLYHQGPVGHFTETTTEAKLLCIRFHYGQLIDVTNDGRLDFLCSDEEKFPQKIYDTLPFPWRKVYDHASPARYLPAVPFAVDSVLADFNNDGRQDLFVLGGIELRPSSVAQNSSTHFESQLTGGIKGFRFVSPGRIHFDIDWNKQDLRTTTSFTRIEIGASGYHPADVPFTLDPTDSRNYGMPPAPAVETDIPVMRVGYDPASQRWTLVIHPQLTATSPLTFSEAYLTIDSTAPITELVGTGFEPTDDPHAPTLLTNYSGGFVDETVRAGLNVPIECSAAVPGDFDNDGDVDLYFICRTGASNLPNQLWENLGDGTFRRVADAGGAQGPVGLAVKDGAGVADMVVTADYDVDGFLDLFITNGSNLRPLGAGGPNVLFHNKGNGKRWLEFDLVGKQSDRDATGARIWVTTGGKRQLREQNGAYHRWSQDAKRAHFGVGAATTADVRVEWPSGTVQNFTNVPTGKLYKVTEGTGIAPVALGVAPPYQCGPPPLNGAIDKGVFVYEDCPTGQWRLRTVAAGASAIFAGTITSSLAFVSVAGVALNSADTLDTTDPKKIVFRFDTRGSAQDGVNFVAREGASACLRITTPAGGSVYYGPFRKPLTTPIDLNTRKPCT